MRFLFFLSVSVGNPLTHESLTGLRRDLVSFLQMNRHHNPQSVGDDPFGAASGKEHQMVAVLGQSFSIILQLIGRPHISLLFTINNLVEAHCYGIKRTRRIVEQHVVEKIDGNQCNTFRPRRSSSVTKLEKYE